MHETPGVTRDRKELLCEWTGTWFRLIDTGGVDEADGGPFGSKIAEQARAAIDEADLVLFVVDARAGMTPGDEELAVILRAAKRPVIVLANKIDDPRRDSRLGRQFHRLGLGEPWPALGAARSRHGRPARRDRLAPAGHERGRDRGRSDPRRNPRPSERGQVVAAEPARRDASE